MKKIMIMAAVAFVAVASQAAAVGWQCAGATAFAGGDYGVYVLGMNGVSDVAQIVALATAGEDLSSYQFGSGTVAANGAATLMATVSGKTITYNANGTTADNTYQAFILMFDAAGENASYTALASTTLANDTTSKTFTLGNQSANLTANTFAVPEPTSGLLMLVGLAGLALRRRRA